MCPSCEFQDPGQVPAGPETGPETNLGGFTKVLIFSLLGIVSSFSWCY